MRVCVFSAGGTMTQSRIGLVEGDRVYEVEGSPAPNSLFETDRVLVRRGEGCLLSEANLRAPVPRPGKIIATIVNTKGMLGGEDVQLTRPRLDMKAPSTVIGPGDVILAPPSGIRPEVELAAVIGVRLTGASVAQASGSLFGYVVLNDVTAPADSKDDAYEAYRRDPKSGSIEKRTMRGPLFRSKNHDTFCPIGPWIVTADEAGQTDSRRMTTKFEGQVVQDGSTEEYIFDAAHIASYVSSFLTLEPGDIVSCGSVGWTKEALGSLDPTEFLLPKREGILELEIEGIGRLSNPVAMK